MKLSVLIFLIQLALINSLTCDEEIKCCRIVKAQKIYQKLGKKGDAVVECVGCAVECFGCTLLPEEKSHQAIMVTLENKQVRFVELPSSKKPLKCSIDRKEKEDGHTPLTEEIRVTNSMMLSRLQAYGSKFLWDKDYGLLQHEPLGLPLKKSDCENCITLADHLWEKLKKLRYSDPDDVALPECIVSDDSALSSSD